MIVVITEFDPLARDVRLSGEGVMGTCSWQGDDDPAIGNEVSVELTVDGAWQWDDLQQTPRPGESGLYLEGVVEGIYPGPGEEFVSHEGSVCIIIVRVGTGLVDISMSDEPVNALGSPVALVSTRVGMYPY